MSYAKPAVLLPDTGRPAVAVHGDGIESKKNRQFCL